MSGTRFRPAATAYHREGLRGRTIFGARQESDESGAGLPASGTSATFAQEEVAS
jgi:hypothetical protein